ncbi:inner centromere protein-like [Portunus trituberculatus]|uniref:inner centromere protein-like n=1 Tax=Portunus trituberculatus TaxID=210409 RepID=UPI001E1CFF40|nr:inner centromere protein-like [Portunus trituberculatus]
MEEDCSFVAPGHIPTRWHRPPGHPQNHRGFHHSLPNQRNAQAYQSNTWGYQSSGQGYPSAPQHHHYNSQAYHNKAQAYQQETFSCGPCNRTFHSKYQYEQHLQEHVKCPFPECNLNAHPKAIEKHIDNQHLLVNFANLQIDDEAWVAERKRRFPTSQRAELRRAQQLEKVKRGEKLGKSLKRFASRGGRGKGRGRGRGRGGGCDGREGSCDSGDVKNEQKRPANSEWSNQRGRKRKRMLHGGRKDKVEEEIENKERNVKAEPSCALKEAPQHQRSTQTAAAPLPDPDSDEEDARDGIPAFRGTRHFYESTGEISYFGVKSGTAPDSAVKEEEVKEAALSEVVISDEEDWEENGPRNVSSGGAAAQSSILVLGGALGSLMGAYSDSEGDSDSPESRTLEAGRQCATQHQSQNATNNQLPCKTQAAECDITKKESNERSAAAPEPVTTTTTTAIAAVAAAQHATTTKITRQRRRKRHPKNGMRKGPRPPGGVHRSFPKRRKTLLERLLLPDVTRERNIILQCVRFIIQNSFFLPKHSTEKGKEKGERTAEKDKEEQMEENLIRVVEEEKMNQKEENSTGESNERSEGMETQSQGEKEGRETKEKNEDERKKEEKGGDEEGKEKTETTGEEQEKEKDLERKENSEGKEDNEGKKETEDENMEESTRNNGETEVELICEEDEQKHENGKEEQGV